MSDNGFIHRLLTALALPDLIKEDELEKKIRAKIAKEQSDV